MDAGLAGLSRRRPLLPSDYLPAPPRSERAVLPERDSFTRLWGCSAPARPEGCSAHPRRPPRCERSEGIGRPMKRRSVYPSKVGDVRGGVEADRPLPAR